jgi:CubicO group peptidase (beta-lactamase class C family)
MSSQIHLMAVLLGPFSFRAAAGAEHARTLTRTMFFRQSFAAAVVCVTVTASSLVAAETIWPSTQWEEATPADVGLSQSQLEKARDYALTGGGSGFVTRHGKLVMSWGDTAERYDLKSTTKSIGVTALGLAIADGKIRLDDKVVGLHPTFALPPESNRKTGWIEQVTIQHLATQTAGFEKPGGYTRLIFQPGTKWAYSDGGPNWLAECVTLAYRRDVQELMFERVFTPLGIDRKDLTWRRNSYRDAMIDGVMRREFGSGISANVDAMARIGYLYLRHGKWRDSQGGRAASQRRATARLPRIKSVNKTRFHESVVQIIPEDFVATASTIVTSVVGLPEVGTQHGNASDHYGLLWWNNADGTLRGVPRDAFWSWGLYDSLIVVIPSLDIVVARAGKSWKRSGTTHYDVLKPFLVPIVNAARKKDAAAFRDSDHFFVSATADGSPYPPSPVIKGIRWAPASTIVRKAKGSDNWPVTWADDDLLYTAYGDGRGFEPHVGRKLSMGLCKVIGEPDSFRGVNLRTSSAERTGDGARGPKVSGMLMVDGLLYMLVRNTDNSQLACSGDHGRTWTWSDWRFTSSFGYPTFLNFGRNYDRARDDYVYIYSHDSDSAYERADRMVLARVFRKEVRNRDAYEFFERLDHGVPEWTADVDQRGAVFEHDGSCYRSSVSYNAPLQRYLWCQTGVGRDTRFRGGLAIYDAPEPWGPWTTAYFTSTWDVGPGETSCLPTKWISDDGRSIHLVFSGDDCFSVRKGTLVLSN